MKVFANIPGAFKLLNCLKYMEPYKKEIEAARAEMCIRDSPSPLDSLGDFALVDRTCSCDPLRKYLSSFSHILLKLFDVFIIYGLCLLYTSRCV